MSPGDVPFGDADGKVRMSPSDRANIVVKYIPASRDLYSMTRLALGSFGKSLMRSIMWEHEKEIQALIESLDEKINSEAAIIRINRAINSCWGALNAADTETTAHLSILPPDFYQVLKAATIFFEPSATGRRLGLENLSDGQRSLFHFALVTSLLELKLALEEEVKRGVDTPFNSDFTKAPALSIFAFEEPENHLAPYFLTRLMMELRSLVATHRAQGLVTSHSPSIVGRLEPTSLRYMNRCSSTGVSIGCKLELPQDDVEAAKFVREAVKAHPEIYFARHAVFGEGASEEIVLPRLAEALGVPIDKSFVAVVPIGGRYIKHFWRLTSQLGISHTTLMDFDLGRSSGDILQLKNVAQALFELYLPNEKEDREELARLRDFDGTRTWGADKDNWNTKNFKSWIIWLEQYGVFFSKPLDLDFTMLKSFYHAYKHLPQNKRGPQRENAQEKQLESCKVALGEQGKQSFGTKPYEDTEYLELFPWYTYLFLGSRGKPAVHLSALAQLSNEELKNNCPPVYKRLIERVKNSL